MHEYDVMTVSVLVITSKQSRCKKVGSEKQKKVTAYVYIYIYLCSYTTLYIVYLFGEWLLYSAALHKEKLTACMRQTVFILVFLRASVVTLVRTQTSPYFLYVLDRETCSWSTQPHTHTNTRTQTHARTHTHTHTYMHYIYINPVTSHPYLIPESTSTLL